MIKKNTLYLDSATICRLRIRYHTGTVFLVESNHWILNFIKIYIEMLNWTKQDFVTEDVVQIIFKKYFI